MVSDSPLTCQMFTIFSMAAAKYFPLTLQATGAKFGSPGDPRLPMHSTEVSSLKTDKEDHKHHISVGEEKSLIRRKRGTHPLLKTHVCCRVYRFLVTFQMRTVPSFPLVARRPFLLHHPHVITYKIPNDSASETIQYCLNVANTQRWGNHTLLWWASSLKVDHFRRSPATSAKVCGRLWLSRS